MSGSAGGAVLGLLFAVGLLVSVGAWLRTGRPSMARRIAWHAGGSRLVDPLRPLWIALLASVLPGGMARALRGAPGGDPGQGRGAGLADHDMGGVVGQLARAGRDCSPRGVERYRLMQLGWAALGMVGGVTLAVATIVRGASPVGLLLLAVIGAVLGLLAADRQLVRQARRRQRRLLQQLPGVAELLAFAVAAGEAPVLALERVAVTVTGDLAAEVRVAIADLRDGMVVGDALRGVAQRCGTAEIDRFIDGIVVALERGTPIADVLRAQACDARSSERNRLMELAGRKEVAMLIPVVFLILPTVVLVALFPGFTTLQLIVP